MGYVTRQSILVYKPSALLILSNLFEDRTTVSEIYKWHIFRWGAETLLKIGEEHISPNNDHQDDMPYCNKPMVTAGKYPGVDFKSTLRSYLNMQSNCQEFPSFENLDS